MKHYCSIFLILSGFVSCTSDDLLLEETASDVEQTSTDFDLNRRSYAEVLEIARNSISMLQAENSDTRANCPGRDLDLEDGVKVVLREHTRSGDADICPDTLLYVFNFKDNQGFSVVSTCRQTDGLIAVVENGNYNPAEPTGNPGFDSFMEMARIYVENEYEKNVFGQNSDTRSSDHPLMCKPFCDTLFYEKVSPKIGVRWGQEGRMGQFCPNGISGCANTAAAQIMSYFKYPNSISLTYPNRDANTTVLDWIAMCNHIYTYWWFNRDSADLQIGRLARQLGVMSGSSYYDGKTGTTIDKIRNVLSSLGYQVGTIKDINPTVSGLLEDKDMYWFASALSLNELILMRGSNLDGIGHEWVIDGCYHVKAQSGLLATYDGITWSVYQEMYTHRTCHNHINWGWDGSFNGYFNAWIYSAGKPVKYDSADNPSSHSGYIFVNKFKCFTVTK